MPPTAPAPSAAAAAAIHGSLRLGSRGTDVRTVQTALNAQTTTRPALATDAVFGMRTSQAVQRFQAARNLGADGVVGPATACALGLAYTPVAGGSLPTRLGSGRTPGGAPAPTPTGPPSPQTELAALLDAVARGIASLSAAVVGLVESLEAVPQALLSAVRSTVLTFAAQVGSAIRATACYVALTMHDLVGTVYARIRGVLGQYLARVADFLARFADLPGLGGLVARIVAFLRQSVEAVLAVVLDWMQAGAGNADRALQHVLNLMAAAAQRVRGLA